MSQLSANPMPRRRRKETAQTIFFWLFLPVILATDLFCFTYPFGQVQRQHRILTTYQPVRAKVLSSRVAVSQDSHGVDQYDPDIRYQYDVDGKTYQSDEVTPIYVSSSQDWADSLVATYNAGQACDAYYDPANPTQAVLVHRYFFSPYRMLLESAFMLTSTCFMCLYWWFGKKQKLTPAENGWFAIAPAIGQRDRLFTAKTCVIVWYIFCVIPTVHYLVCVPSPHSHGAFFGTFYALGLVPVLFFIRYWRMSRNMDEARFLVDQPEGILGKPLRFSVTQMVRRQLELKQAALRLQCLGIKSKSRSVVFETTLAEAKERILHMGEQLTLSGEITLPANQPPGGRDATGKFDWIAWKCFLKNELRHAPDYSMEYRIEVLAPQAEIPVPEVRSRAYADVRAIEPEFAGRIMSKRNWAVGQLLICIPLVIQLPSCVLALMTIISLFPNKNDPKPILTWPRQEIQQALGISIGLMAISSFWGLAFTEWLRTVYFRRVAKQEIQRRPDAILQPDANSQLVTIIPRENWNRAMLKEQTDCGLLTLDSARREIRFEGDKERYRIPVDALLSCDVEKSVFMSAAKPSAPGYFMVVLRAQTASGIWEAPVAPTVATGIFNSKSRQRAAEALQARIQAMNPVMMTAKASTL